MDLTTVLQRLYDEEIGFRLECFPEDGFRWGVMVNEREISWVEGRADTAATAIAAIGSTAARLYPSSELALWWSTLILPN